MLPILANFDRVDWIVTGLIVIGVAVLMLFVGVQLQKVEEEEELEDGSIDEVGSIDTP